MLSKERLPKVKIGPLSNYPKRQRQFLSAGRITDDAREKELLATQMQSLTG
jgi:hypothetical protein